MLIGMNITVPKRKRALLLHYAGPEVDEIFDTLQNTGDDSDYATAVEKLNEYFSPQTNIAYEVYNFRQTKQKEGESLDSYHTRLRQLVKTCEFSNIDKEIKERIILACSSNSLRRRALRENFTLDALLKLGRALELSEEQARQVEKAAADVNSTETKGSDRPGRARQRNEHSSQSRFRRSQSRNRQNSNKRNSKPGKCGNCEGYAPHRNPCPARGKSCNACGKIGHFAHVCRTNPSAKDGKVASLGTGYSSEDEYEYAYTINYIESKKPPMCQVQVNGKAVEMMIDTGASVSLLDEATFNRIDCGNKLLEHAHSKIYSYGSDTPLPRLGTLSTTIKSISNSTTTRLHVVKGNMGNLSYNTAQKLGLITISVNTTTVTDVNKNSPESLQEEFECLFGSIGRLRNKIV